MTNTKTIGIVCALLTSVGVIMYLFASDRAAMTIRNIGAWENNATVQNATSTRVSAGSNEEETYTHPNIGFSFRYPKGFSVNAFAEGEEGEMMLAQSGDGKSGFQIFVLPFDEPGPITKERILKDIPNLTIESPQEVLIGGEKALVFFDHNASLGRTREAWMIHGDHIYQITAPAEFDGELARIMVTWRF